MFRSLIDYYFYVCNWTPIKSGWLRNEGGWLRPYLTGPMSGTSHAALIRNDTPQLNYSRRQPFPRPAPPVSPPPASPLHPVVAVTGSIRQTLDVYLNIFNYGGRYGSI